jgi:hypothetical protein
MAQSARNGFRNLVVSLAVILIATLQGSCGGGKNLGQALDDLAGKVASLAGQLGSTAGLTERQLFDILNLEIQRLRSDWKGMLNDSITQLDQEQQTVLNNLKKAIDNVDGLLTHIDRMQDYAVIDVNVLLAKLGLGRDNQVRRIEPSAQSYKRDGSYEYLVTFPIFGTDHKITKISVGGYDVTKSKTDALPHGFRVSIPAETLNKLADESQLVVVDLVINIETPAPKGKFLQKPLQQDVSVSTGLFPKYPLRYWLASHPKSWEIDDDPAHIQVVNAPQTLIPGCGNSGCYLSYQVCATTPVGTQPLGDFLNPHDSFIGWGDFAGGVSVAGNVVCRTYVQHSHNQNRNVWFSTSYRPLKEVQHTLYHTLAAVSLGATTPMSTAKNSTAESGAAETPTTTGGNGGGFVPIAALISGVQSAIDAQAAMMRQAAFAALVQVGAPLATIQSIAAQPKSNVNTAPPGGGDAVPNPQYSPPNGDTGPTPRPLEFARTYFVPMQKGTNWELEVRAFTGEHITLSPSQLTPNKKLPQVITASWETDRLRFDTNQPY